MKEIFIQAATGQGKSYETAMNALFLSVIQNRPCIIATSSKMLVDQYIDLLEHIYTTKTIKNIKLSDSLISISKHTKDEPLSNNTLLDYFTNGKCIIVTVHNYLQNFDDFKTPNYFNSLINIFAPILNISVDEANLLFNKLNTSHVVLRNYIREYDSLRLPINKDYIKDWKNCDEKTSLLIKQEGFEKQPNGTSGGYNISIKNSQSDCTDIDLIFSKTIDGGDINNLISLNKNKKLDMSLDTSFKYTKVWEGYNYQTIEVDLIKDVKKHYFLKNFQIGMQNHVSLVLEGMFDKNNSRRKTELAKMYVKFYHNQKEHEPLYDIVINELQDMFYNAYIKKMPLSETDHFLLKKHLELCFKYYKEFLLKKESLFLIIVYKTANEAILNKLFTSSQLLLNYYYPRGIIGDVSFEIISLKERRFKITISNIINEKFYSPILFFKYAKNKSQHNLLSKKILTIYNKNNGIEEKNEEEGECVNGKEIIQNKNNNILLIDSTKLSEGDKLILIKEADIQYIRGIDDYYLNFTILLKKSENSTIFPYGMEIYCKHELGLQNLSKGNLIYLSAKYSDHNLITHKVHNENYCNYLNLEKKIEQKKTICINNNRKIDKLFIIQSENELFQQSVNKEFYQSFWDNFIYRFYLIFCRKKKTT
jgi:hypothetical protein